MASPEAICAAAGCKPETCSEAAAQAPSSVQSESKVEVLLLLGENMADRHDERLRKHLARLTRSGTLEEFQDLAGRPEAVGPDAQKTRSILTKLRDGSPLSTEERFHTEAIIVPDQRPVVDFFEGNFDDFTHPLWMDLNADAARAGICRAAASIGRIELPGNPQYPYGGTGFVVGDNLLMTNRHVAELFASGLGLRGLAFRPGNRAGIDFIQEKNRADTDFLEVDRVEMIHPHWDMALLRVRGLTKPVLKLSPRDPSSHLGRRIVVIGYPGFDPRNPADVQNKVFRNLYYVKRLQPGLIREHVSTDSFYHEVIALSHDSSTLGGNSGSALIDVETFEVLALHFKGVYLDANFAVPVGELARDARVVNAGVRFDGPASTGPNTWDGAWVGNESGPPSGNGRSDGVIVGGGAREGDTLRIPFEVTIRLGQGGASVQSSAASANEAMVEPYHEKSYANRKGYDPEFLETTVPLPKPLNAGALVRVADGGHELRYHHFSVAMHAKRRIALFTASNVDASPARKRPGNRLPEDYSRKSLAKLADNDREKWFSDPRIPADCQLPDRFFTKDRQAFDKGHLVRRDDVAWGDTYREQQFANGDTYHVTNCSPQVSVFNQSAQGVDNWGDLENLVLKQAKTERLCVFAGPVLDEHDRVFYGEDDEGPIEVQIPSRYWKLIVAKSDADLQAFAFVLEQDLSSVDFEFVVPKVWRQYMISVEELQSLAQVRFAREIRDGDQANNEEGVKLGLRKSSGSESTQPSPAGVATTEETQALVEAWQSEQENSNTGGARFVLNFQSRPDIDRLAVALGAALHLEFSLNPLFDPDPDLDGFLQLVLPRVVSTERSDLFEMARHLQRVTGAATVDPDLGTGYYAPEPSTKGGGPESADSAAWCWSDVQPKNPDWAVMKTGVREAWEKSLREGRVAKGRGIRVFQPDTGVVPTHGELPPHCAENAGAGNLLEDGELPIDPMKHGSNPGHGTGTGSVVASPEGGRMTGVAPEATLLPVRCVESVAVFNQSRVAKAIDHARRNRAHVITMSLGGVFSAALHAAVRKAVDENIIVIAAAGNCVLEVVWPARYKEVIAVGGINEAMKPWRGSSRGSAVDISGPAEMVQRADARVSGDPDHVSLGQGTSFATAHLAGTAALWLAHHGRDELIAKLPKGVRLQYLFMALIRSSATVPAEDFDPEKYGAGITNAVGLLEASVESVLSVESVFAPETTDIKRQVADLVASSLGKGGLEAAAPAIADLQNAAELACIAFDRLQAGASRRAAAEALPPRAASAQLRKVLGPSIGAVIGP